MLEVRSALFAGWMTGSLTLYSIKAGGMPGQLSKGVGEGESLDYDLSNCSLLLGILGRLKRMCIPKGSLLLGADFEKHNLLVSAFKALNPVPSR